MTIRMEQQKQPISAYTCWLGIFFLSLIVGALHIGAIGSLLRIIGFIPIGIWLLNRRSVRFSGPIVCSTLFVVWISLTYVWSIEQATSFSRIVSQVSFLLLLLSAASYRFSTHEIEFLKNCLVWGSRITAIIVLISSDYILGRIYLDSIVQEDPNYLCAYFSFALVMALTSLISGAAKGWMRLVYILELILYAYIILGTGSRGGLFAILAAVAIVILFTPPKRNKSAHMFRRVGIVAVLFIAAYVAMSLIEKDILLRFTLSEIEESNGTGRYDIWDAALNAFDRSDILRELCGYGTGTARDITFLPEFSFPRHSVIHNMFIENLLEAGVFGVVLYICHVFSFFGMALKRRDVFCVAVMVCMIVLSLSTSIYTFKPYWNIMLFILCLNGHDPDLDPSDEPDLPDEPYEAEGTPLMEEQPSHGGAYES